MHTQMFYEILVNRTDIGLYLPFSKSVGGFRVDFSECVFKYLFLGNRMFNRMFLIYVLKKKDILLLSHTLEPFALLIGL